MPVYYSLFLTVSKASDPLKLNEIFSHAKKWRQRQSTEQEKKQEIEKLKKSIAESKLPELLKSPMDKSSGDLFSKESFLHLVCAYYKMRQRARDGRLYIHPEYRYVKGRGYENTGRFDDKNHLLSYCNHKPRQKKYQSFYDIAGVLQVSPQKLEEIVGSKDDEKLIAWLKNFKEGRASLKGICGKAATMQKEHRGFLKENIGKAIFRCEIEDLRKEQKKNKNNLSSEELGKLKKYSETKAPDKNDNELLNLDKNIKNLSYTVAQALFGEKLQQDDPRVQKFCSVFSFAQINNIAFKERSGNANTCSVCSADNAQRMQTVASEKNREDYAKAQRLPAIEMRLIDGAVMRMARIVGDAIAKDKWEKVEGALREDKRVYIPIITESNRFEFEPNLREIKGKNLKDTEKKNKSEGQKKLAISKNERITEASLGICPYTDDKLGNASDKDHIIPRSSKWGTLNDEANLIWASDKGNKEIKKEQEFSLSQLKANYKKKQFDNKSDEEIRTWIIKQIGDGEGEDFKFGKYRSFINLSPDEQRAFRHALFLKGDRLREKVIRAIDNRMRSLVNGTQRYFAETLANKLYKEAKSIGKEQLLSFDYFGVEAQDNSRGDGIHNLREAHEKAFPEIDAYKKKATESQKNYSHLIDAQLAFAIVADSHKKDGSLKLNIDDSISLWPLYADTGEVLEKTIFGAIQVRPEEMKEVGKLKRRKVQATSAQFAHQLLFNERPGAWHFLKLIEIETNEDKYYLKGFLDLKSLKLCLQEDKWRDAVRGKYGYGIEEKFYPYAALLENIEKDELINLYTVGEDKNQFGYKSGKKEWPKVIIEKQGLGKCSFTVRLYQIDKTKVARFLLDNFNTKSDPTQWSEESCKTLDSLALLWYITKRKNLVSDNTLLSYQIEDLETGGFLNPSLLQAWQQLDKEWEKFNKENINDFLPKHFLRQGNKEAKIFPHQKTRKEFSLPQKSTGQGWFLVRRKKKVAVPSQDEFTYQCLSEENKISKFAITENDSQILTSQYRQLSLFMFPKKRGSSSYLKEYLSPLKNIKDPEKWTECTVSQEMKKKLEKIEKKLGDDVRRPFYRLTFKKEPIFGKEFIELIKDFALPRGVLKKVTEELIADVDWSAPDQWREKLGKDKEKSDIRDAFDKLKDLHGKIKQSKLLEYRKG